MSIDPQIFRKALGCFATGVSVVTTRDPLDNLPVGVTVSAFASLSLAPPLVLFCLGNETSRLAAYGGFGYFAVNILSKNQQDLSNRFAGQAGDKWSQTAWESWDSGVPVLTGCLANLECKIVNVIPGGDHQIFIGEVIRLRCQEPPPEGEGPLLYFQGRYAGLSP